MNHQNHQSTAIIYQFPTRVRENIERRRLAQSAGLAHYLSTSTAPLYSGAWYHDAAIKEEEAGLKR
jgi:Protein of unknown function (DUF2735)